MGISKSKSKSIISAATMENIGANITIGIDEVVNVFISEYEENLYERKKTLSSILITVKADLKTFKDGEYKTFNEAAKKKYNKKTGVLNINTRVDTLSVFLTESDLSYCEKKRKKDLPFIRIDIRVSQGEAYIGDVQERQKIPVTYVNKLAKLTDAVESATSDLAEVLSLLNDISRKERLIRGKISKVKLESMGMDDLMANTELTKLIQIP